MENLKCLPKNVLLFRKSAQDAIKIAYVIRCNCVCITILCVAHMCIYVPCFRSNQNAYFTYEKTEYNLLSSIRNDSINFLLFFFISNIYEI